MNTTNNMMNLTTAIPRSWEMHFEIPCVDDEGDVRAVLAERLKLLKECTRIAVQIETETEVVKVLATFIFPRSWNKRSLVSLQPIAALADDIFAAKRDGFDVTIIGSFDNEDLAGDWLRQP